MDITLIGPSGVGKGTHATALETHYGLTHLVTGELLRENVERRRAVGFLASRYVREGVLVPDEVVDAMVAEWMWSTRPTAGVLFDGFPRTVYQAQFLDDLLEELGRGLDAAIYLSASPTEIRRRLLGRIVCQDCHTSFHLTAYPPQIAGQCDVCSGRLAARPDDIPEMIRVRLRTFRRAIGPVLEYYREQNRLIVIDGEGDPEHISQAILAAVEAARQGHIPQLAPDAAAEIGNLLREEAIAAVLAERRLNVVLFGGPGSGKGTQAEQLTSAFTLPHIATGDLFRDNLKRETDLGKLAQSYMEGGALVPDEVTEAMVEERLTRPDANEGFILDGFPRTLPQAEALAEIMGQLQRDLSAVLYIRVSDDEIVRRLSGRLICRDCQTPYHKAFKPPNQSGVCDRCGGELYQRADDNPKTIRNRLKTFHAQTSPIVEFYKHAGLLIEIRGEGPVAEVVEQTTHAVQTLTQ